MLEMAAEDADWRGELERALASLDRDLRKLQEEALFTGEYDSGPAVVGVHAGAGGTDSQDWAEMLLRMYLRWAEARGLKAAAPRGDAGRGGGAEERDVHARPARTPTGSCRPRRACTGWCGSRRSTPPTAATPRFAQVEVSPLVDDDVDVEIDEADLRIDTYRSQGAGGQHVNKTDSAVRITHLPTGIVVQCQNERSQLQNKAQAMRILKSRLLEREREEREAALAKERGEAQDISFGSQIRSYVLHPYTMVNDHRTNLKIGNAQGVLDGDLDELVHAELLRRATAA